MAKRPIDRLRESAKSSKIGVDGDDSAITRMIVIDDKMHFVKEKGVYLFLEADQIDPNRTNEKIPDTQQRILAAGSDDPVVGRVLLTAHTLFDDNRFDSQIDTKKALRIALEITKDILDLQKIKTDLSAAHQRCRDSVEKQKHRSGAFPLPSAGSLESIFDAFTQKVGHVVKSMQILAQIFYGADVKKRWIESLTALVKQRYGDEDLFLKFLEDVGPILRRWMEIRNAVEHPSEKNVVLIRDFHYLPNGQISYPTVDLTCDGHSYGNLGLLELVSGIADTISVNVEVYIANLASVNAAPFSGVQPFVAEFPESERSDKMQRFYYAVDFGGRIIRFG